MLEKIEKEREAGIVTTVGDGVDVEAIIARAEKEMSDKGISLKELVGAAGEEPREANATPAKEGE